LSFGNQDVGFPSMPQTLTLQIAPWQRPSSRPRPTTR
jgi:hypothetical protein